MPTTPDILFENGTFWTGNRLNAYAGHVACAGGKITAVGTDLHPGNFGTVGIDLKGHFAMPGFIDAHAHFRLGGAMLNRLDLRGVRDESEFAEAVGSRARTQSAGTWLVGGNWDHENWKSRRLPGKELIDRFTSTFPVFLDRIDTHLALVNSKALETANITRSTPDPQGGVIVRDGNGEPTGILKDAAREMVIRLIPQPPLEELMRDAREAMKLANSLGVTSVNEIGPERDLNAYVELRRRGELTVRIEMVLPIADRHALAGRGIPAVDRPVTDEWIRLGTVKAFADGSLGAGTALFYEPYRDDSSNYGLATELLSSGEIERCAIDADTNHIRLAIHAIGDRAVGDVLDVYRNVVTNNPKWDRRLRIEHAQHVRDADFRRFAELQVVASVQPYHCVDDGRWALRKIGESRAKSSFAFRRFLDEGVTIAFGTDWPVAPLDPLLGIHAAVTRATTDGKNPGGWIPEQSISVEEALRAYTFGSAYASSDENRKGTLEEGRLADIVVLSRNPFEVRPEELKDLKVVMTVVGGKLVYSDGTILEEGKHGLASA